MGLPTAADVEIVSQETGVSVQLTTLKRLATLPSQLVDPPPLAPGIASRVQSEWFPKAVVWFMP